jgi:hypothetical protein
MAPPPTAFALRLAKIAEGQHTRFHMQNEADPALCKQIQRYWTDIGLTFTSCVDVPWSAVFVSSCVKQAGATADEFRFAAAHSVFVRAAIRNAIAQTGVFRAFPISAHAPGVGDIIQNNRGGETFDFDFARTHSAYASHSAIVIEVGSDSAGLFALTIGGNESDSIRQTVVRLTPTRLVRQRLNNPFICVIRNLKP